jgi:dTDP-4-amino-4,6-dideoxygalactose transaminase
LCAFTGKKHAISVSSGSAALYLALAAYDIDGASAAIPASSFPAIREACEFAKVEPIFQDCDGELNTVFDSDAVEFICPVQNLGVVQTHSITHSIAEWRDTVAPAAKIIVDCAAAMLTPNAFDVGDVFCVSFNWNKSVSGGGGGAVLTDDMFIADRVHALKRHGGPGAFNFQCPALCASETLSQLLGADGRRGYLKELSMAYDLELEAVGLMALPHGKHRWVTATLLESSAQVDEAIKEIAKLGLMARRYWPPLCTIDKAPNAWDVHRRGIMLPGGYEITVQDIRQVCEVLSGI